MKVDSVFKSIKIIAVALLLGCVDIHAQLRIVNYNTAKRSNAELKIIFQAMRDEQVNGISRMPDIFVFQEQTGNSINKILDIIDDAYGAILYEPQASPLQGSAGGDVVLVYRADTVHVLEEVALTTGGPRPTMRYKLRPIGYDDKADFYIYGSHLKASTGSYNEQTRRTEVAAIRADADTLGSGTKIIYTGDLNLYGSSEGAFVNYVAAGNGQAFDPVNMVGNWHNNITYKLVHTQSPLKSSSGGLAGGGVDDRFDFQLLSANFVDSEGLSYATGTYRTFGNDGSHIFDEAINSGTWSPPGVINPASVRDALVSATDHLPVVADYQLPAKLGVVVNTTPVIIGAPTNSAVNVLVVNAALVTVSNGADELDYNGVATGDLSGTFSNTVLAATGENVHSLNADTTAVGVYSGVVSVTATSDDMPISGHTQSVSYAVRTHSEASFSSSGDMNSLSLNLGTFDQFSGIINEEFNVYNLEAVANLTAGADIDSMAGSGDTGALSLSIVTPFESIPAGTGQLFHALLDTATAGSFSASYTLTVSDEDLPGATAGANLTLNLTGTVTAGAEKLRVSPTKIVVTTNKDQTAQFLVTLSNEGGTSLNWNLAENESWLSVNTTSGMLNPNNSVVLTFVLDSTGLAQGQYDTGVSISAAGAQTISLPVSLIVEDLGELLASPSNLTVTQGAGQQTNVNVFLTNEGNKDVILSLSHNATTPGNWLVLSPTVTSIPAGGQKAVSVTLDARNLLEGTYNATITVTPDTGEYDILAIPVTLTVTPPPPPNISVSPASLSLNRQSGKQGTLTINISNTAALGSDNLVYGIIDDATQPEDWITLSNSGGTVTPGGTDVIDVTLNANNLEPNTYNAKIYITSNDPDSSTNIVTVTFEVVPAVDAQLVINPNKIEKHILAGQSVTNTCELELIKGSASTVRWATEFHDNTGKYLISHSDQENGPTFQWTDISTVGTAIDFGTKKYKNVPLPFDMPFYDRVDDRVFVNIHGYISFNTWATYNAGQFLPAEWKTGNNSLLALFWGTHPTVSGTGTIYYHSPAPDTMIIQYHEWSVVNSTEGLIAQIVLKSNGDIYLYYKNIPEGASYIAGIQNNETEGTYMRRGQWTYSLPGDDFLHDDFAIHIKRLDHWMSFSMQKSGQRSLGDEPTCIDFSFDASNLTPGDYVDNITYRFYLIGEERTTQAMELPVILHVHETPYDMWAAQYFEGDDIEGGVANKDQDADGDGLPNAQEYIQKTDPTDPTNDGIPLNNLKIKINSDLQLSWRQRTGGTGSVGLDYKWQDATITVEFSEDLLQPGSWQQATTTNINTFSVVSNGDGTDNVTVQILSPLSSLSRLFARLKINF